MAKAISIARAVRQGRTASRTATVTAAVLLAFFGVSLVWAAGFANADLLHNGAHDSRHSLVFPCH